MLPEGQFAPVGSISHYQYLEEHGQLGDYHLLLAHKVLDERQEWFGFYEHIRGQGRRPFVIMDNSLIELGHPIEAKGILEASRIVEASCLVLADCLSDARATANLSEKMRKDLEEANRYSARRMPPTLGVVQGENIGYSIWCAERLFRLGVRYFSVPRVFTDNCGSREPLIISLWTLYRNPLHLLGFSENMGDDIECTKMEGVMGIDSAVPIRLGLEGTEWSPDTKTAPRRKDYLEDTRTHPQVIDNVKSVRSLLNAH